MLQNLEIDISRVSVLKMVYGKSEFRIMDNNQISIISKMSKSKKQPIACGAPIQQAEDALKQLGVPMVTAVEIFLRQIALSGSIPIAVALPKAPDSVNANKMTPHQLHEAIQAGLDDLEAGNLQDVGVAFAKFRKQHA